jgi:uncharacterized protein DUF2877
MTSQHVFTCTSIGQLHDRLVHEERGTIGKVLNAFDTTINVRTNADELLVITLGKLRSPVNLNVISNNSSLGFKQIVGQDAMASIQIERVGKPNTMSLLIGEAVITILEHDNYRNHLNRPGPGAIQAFASNSGRIFSALLSQAKINRLGCLLNPDVTTRGLFATFTKQILQDMAIAETGEFKDRISTELLEMCGKGPGFTPAGDDFIAGYMALYNWLKDSMKLGGMMVPDRRFSQLTTWTSFKLIEYSARNLLDDQAQEMINSIAGKNIDAYIRCVELISKRGHTSGIDFATGMTMALFTIEDRIFKAGVLESMVQASAP